MSFKVNKVRQKAAALDARVGHISLCTEHIDLLTCLTFKKCKAECVNFLECVYTCALSLALTLQTVASGWQTEVSRLSGR